MLRVYGLHKGHLPYDTLTMLAIVSSMLSMANGAGDQFYNNPKDVVAELDEDYVTFQCRIKPFDNNDISIVGKVCTRFNNVSTYIYSHNIITLLFI